MSTSRRIWCQVKVLLIQWGKNKKTAIKRRIGFISFKKNMNTKIMAMYEKEVHIWEINWTSPCRFVQSFDGMQSTTIGRNLIHLQYATFYKIIHVLNIVVLHQYWFMILRWYLPPYYFRHSNAYIYDEFFIIYIIRTSHLPSSFIFVVNIMDKQGSTTVTTIFQ